MMPQGNLASSDSKPDPNLWPSPGVPYALRARPLFWMVGKQGKGPGVLRGFAGCFRTAPQLGTPTGFLGDEASLP